MQFLDAKKALARKLNIDYDTIAQNDLFKESDLESYINIAGLKAWDVTFWDFAEHSKKGTLTSTEVNEARIAYPFDIAPSSIYYFRIGGKKFSKRNFTAYQDMFEENPDRKDRVWCEYKRYMFFNTKSEYAVVGALIEIYGKKTYTKLTRATDLLPFSPDQDEREFSGNEAIILLAYAQALSSDKLKNPSQAIAEEKKAMDILGILKSQLDQGRASEQEQDRAMFNVPDLFRGGRARGASPIGGFSM